MQVDIGNNKICHNFSSIVASAEIRDLNERVQHEHAQEGGGTRTLTAPQRRVDPNAGVPPASVEPVSRSARRNSLNLIRSSAGSRHSQQRQKGRRHSHAVPSNTPHSHSAASPSPDEAVLVSPPPINAAPLPSTEANLARAGVSSPTPPMAAVASPAPRQGGNWSDAARNGESGGANGAARGNSNANNKNVGDGSRRADEVAAGSHDNNGSGNQDKPVPPAGPKLAQTKIQLGMRLRRWVIINRIGAGSFGETFTAIEVDGPIPEEDTLAVTLENLALLDHLPPPEERHEVCIKVEQENKNVLRLEALALKKVQPCPQIVRYLGSGCLSGMNYLVMEKLGPNLAELRRRSQHGTFNIYTTLKAGISCLTAIRGVHDLGLVHRDIKPSNFVTGLPNTPEHTTCYLIDFGLARRFRRSNGEIRLPRDNAGFRGTSRYASVASHHHQELGRVDDLWSLLFMLVEFATGTLPWRKYKDKDDIGRCKEESITPHLVRNLPREFQPFLAHLQTLRYEDEPDYDLLITLMHRALERRGYPPNKPVEWEMDPSMVDSGMDMDGHEVAPRREAEKAPQPNAAAPPVVASSPPRQQQQQQAVANVNSAHDAAGNSGNMSPAYRAAAALQQSNLSDTGARKAQLLRTPLSPSGLQSNSATGANNRSTPPAVDLIHVPGDHNINGSPQHQNSGMLRMSDVDVVGAGGGASTRPEASIAPPFATRQPGTFEEPGAPSGFLAEGSDTPAARDSSDDFDPHEFSSRDQPTPANGNRSDYGRSGRPGRPGSASAVATPTPAIPPSSSAVEPSNSMRAKEAPDWRNNGQPVRRHGDGDAVRRENDAIDKVGNAPLQRPMGGPAVDLDAPNNDNAEAQQGPNTKKPSKDKKKSNCDCTVM
ncbi:putative protein kinase [Leptomonas pyrrhocoris]|uniref:non-specific serine/threonine protein kinase n=1 Tax=Leptomonas pyrrhocoris TaxID=157538 RepID=A0A0N0DWZ2_LEPPY|nr:putative protein kinase [Leptomonas pyrrhocoris]KPA82385.1 putative protein kinase [Leptomonas pyrrhocoris]|eukprot:XP_015660824.1 putative protein kinase [Leptomonas pyrrhocoris]